MTIAGVLHDSTYALARREYQAGQLAWEGMSLSDIAARLGCSAKAVRQHLDNMDMIPDRRALLMRGDHDDRSDDEVKLDILRIIREDHGYKVVEAIDDRPRVIRLWQSQGIPCEVVYRADWEQAGELYGDLIDLDGGEA